MIENREGYRHPRHGGLTLDDDFFAADLGGPCGCEDADLLTELAEVRAEAVGIGEREEPGRYVRLDDRSISEGSVLPSAARRA